MRTRPATRPEDTPKTLIFVDILGFEAITKLHQVRVQDFGPDEHGTSGSSTTEMPNRINRFNSVLDRCVFEETLNGGVQAMLFSDCAFLVFETSLRTAVVAAGLKRNFIKRGVPVRMGLGKATFYDIEYVTTTDVGAVTVSKSRFIGAAVVRAHSAEQCGGKGISIRQRVRTMQLSRALNGVKWELDYLHEPRPAGEQPTVDAADRELFDKVAWLKNPDWPRAQEGPAAVHADPRRDESYARR